MGRFRKVPLQTIIWSLWKNEGAQFAKIAVRQQVGGPRIRGCIEQPKYESVIYTDVVFHRGNLSLAVMAVREGFGVRCQSYSLPWIRQNLCKKEDSYSLPWMALAVSLQGTIFRKCRVRGRT